MSPTTTTTTTTTETSTASKATTDSKTTTSAKTTTTKLAIPVDKSTIMTENVLKLILPPSAHPDRIPKGRNASGRTWKGRTQKRASSLKHTRINNQVKSFAERQALKRQRTETLELQQEMSTAKREEAVRRRERRLENERRKAENEYKNLQKSIQTLNTDKAATTLKTMSKKQLRQIKKTRLNPKTGVVEYVSPYAK